MTFFSKYLAYMGGKNRQKTLSQKLVTGYFQTPTNTEFRQSLFLKVYIHYILSYTWIYNTIIL